MSTNIAAIPDFSGDALSAPRPSGEQHKQVRSADTWAAELNDPEFKSTTTDGIEMKGFAKYIKDSMETFLFDKNSETAKKKLDSLKGRALTIIELEGDGCQFKDEDRIAILESIIDLAAGQYLVDISLDQCYDRMVIVQSLKEEIGRAGKIFLSNLEKKGSYLSLLANKIAILSLIPFLFLIPFLILSLL